MTYNTKGEFRCYEIKVTKSDFHSKAANTFIGHYNYYVMPPELYEEVKDEIPPYIGVYTGEMCKKKARRQELKVDEQVLKDSMIRSLCRDVQKQIASGNPTLIEIYKREIAEEKRRAKYWEQRFEGVMHEVLKRYGENWDAGPILFDNDGEVL
nr:MAG TPA: DNA repair protein MmcB-like protein [Caudoviricetes sp.]